MFKKVKFVVFLLLVSLLSPGLILANTEATTSSNESVVDAIKLTDIGDYISWEVSGFSEQGFKVVWSKTSGPTYPLRSGDKYHFYTDPYRHKDVLEAFDGDGAYYVRVCEYLGGKCGVYSNEIMVNLGTIAKESSTNKETDSLNQVASINLFHKGDNVVKWETQGHAKNGFKVVYSLSPNPSYPLREGDKYNYHADPTSYYSELTPFKGSGDYYVRVCEYLGAGCGVYSNEIKVNLTGEKDAICTMEYAPVCAQVQVQCFTTPCEPIEQTFSNKCHMYAADAKYLYSGECGAKIEKYSRDESLKKIEEKTQLLANNQLDAILTELKQLRDQVREQQNEIKYLKSLMSDLSSITSAMQGSINNFITYGVDDNTKKLGEGERAAVMYSYKSAFNKLPENEEELADAIKIANGRWPSKTNEDAENEAKVKFRIIYLRDPDMNSSSDYAAVTIMAYGLRQKAENRNLNSEKEGIKIFKGIFKRLPVSTEDWNAMQAITYSGAKR